MPGPLVLPVFTAAQELQPRTHCELVKPLCPVLKFKCRLCRFYWSTKSCRKTCETSEKYCGSSGCSVSSTIPSSSEPPSDISDNGKNNQTFYNLMTIR